MQDRGSIAEASALEGNGDDGNPYQRDHQMGIRPERQRPKGLVASPSAINICRAAFYYPADEESYKNPRKQSKHVAATLGLLTFPRQPARREPILPPALVFFSYPVAGAFYER